MNNIEIDISPITNKPCMDEEDFIEKYKDSDNQDIQYLINGLIHSFLSDLLTMIGNYKLYLSFLLSDEEISKLDFYTAVGYLEYNRSFLYFEYKNSKDKKYIWKYIDHDINYYWNLKDHCNISIEQAVDNSFIQDIILKGEEKMQEIKNNIELLDESTSGDISKIKKAAARLYSHLMKCTGNDYISTHWIGTIFEANDHLNEVKSSAFKEVANNPQHLEDIKDNAIEIYKNDKNKNPDEMYNYIHGLFPTLASLKDRQAIKNYLIDRATYLGEDYIVEKVKSK